MIGYPKGPTRAAIKAQKREHETQVIKAVRFACMKRDGHCRVAGRVGTPCYGPSEWAHLGDHRRARTRGRDPEERHDVRFSVMLCRLHHHDYDAHAYDLAYDPERGANGPVTVVLGGRRVADPVRSH